MLPPAAPVARPKWAPDRPNTARPSTPPREGQARDWWQKERALAAASTPRRPSPPEAAEEEAWGDGRSLP
eukprot:3346394-Alexandrium_andersonii.AAC.1